MDRRVTVQSLVEIQGTDGQPVATWVDSFTTSCAAVPVAAGERFAAEQTISDETIKFRLRSRAGWRPSPKGNRLKYPITPSDSARFWDITGVAEIGRGQGWEIVAFAGVA